MNNYDFGEKNTRWDSSMWTDAEKTQWLGSDGNSVHYSDDNGEGLTRCLGCMELYSREYDICPNCGNVSGDKPDNPLHMLPGTYLRERYIVGNVIGSGGFGITYIAWDTVLKTKVAIKEYLPSEFSTRAAGQSRITVFTGDKTVQFADGKDKFVDEAKRLAKFQNESGIVKIFDSFEENNTAYIIMEFLDGETLAEYIEKNGKIDAETAIQLITPVIESLNSVHEVGIIHRDVAPDNIFVTKNGEVKLIDFGASRYATTSKSRSLSVLIKPGYSAEEQYRSRGDQGAHTDIYSLSATLYKMITGVTPPDALERRAFIEKNHKDILEPITKYNKEITSNQEAAIYNALNVKIEDRTPDTITFLGELTSEQKVKRRKGTIKKIDPLTWPLWLKIAIPAALVVFITLGILLGTGVIGPKRNAMYKLKEGYVRMPYIVGKSIDEAQEMLDKSSDKNGNSYYLNIVSSEIKESSLPKGTIISTNPGSGYAIENGTSENKKDIKATISIGKGITVVNSGLGVSYAGNESLFADLDVTVIEVDCPVKKGYICAQNEPGGKEVEIGSEIKLTISTGPSNPDKNVRVVNLIGKTYAEAIQLAGENGFYIYFDEPVKSESIINSQSVSAGKTIKAKNAVFCTVGGIKNAMSFIMDEDVMKTYTYWTAAEYLKVKGFTDIEVRPENNKDAEYEHVTKITDENGTELKSNQAYPADMKIIIYYNNEKLDIAQQDKDAGVITEPKTNPPTTRKPVPAVTEEERTYEDYNRPTSGATEYVTDNGLAATTTPPSEPETEETFTVTLNANGGKFKDGKSQHSFSLSSGNKIPYDSYNDTPERSGYIFVGWSSTPSGFNLKSSIYSDVVFDAVWEKEIKETSDWVDKNNLPSGITDEDIVEVRWVYDKKTVTKEMKTIKYATFPKGYKKGSDLYNEYHKSPVTATKTTATSPSSNTTTTVETLIIHNKVVGYIYWHWCRGRTLAEPTDSQMRNASESEFDTFHEFEKPTVVGTRHFSQNYHTYTYKFTNKGVCKDTYHWVDPLIPIYEQKYEIRTTTEVKGLISNTDPTGTSGVSNVRMQVKYYK